MLGMTLGQVYVPNSNGNGGTTFYDYNADGGHYTATGADAYTFTPDNAPNSVTIPSYTPTYNAPVNNVSSVPVVNNNAAIPTVNNPVAQQAQQQAQQVNASVNAQSAPVVTGNSFVDAILGLFTPNKDGKDSNGNVIASGASSNQTANNNNTNDVLTDLENTYNNHKTLVLTCGGLIGLYLLLKD